MVTGRSVVSVTCLVQFSCPALVNQAFPTQERERDIVAGVASLSSRYKTASALWLRRLPPHPSDLTVPPLEAEILLLPWPPSAPSRPTMAATDSVKKPSAGGKATPPPKSSDSGTPLSSLSLLSHAALCVCLEIFFSRWNACMRCIIE